MTPRNQKVVVGLSGGVDSAIAAARLKAQGWDVTTLFMKNWEEDDDAEYCAAREDLAMAQQVVEALDIPLRTVISLMNTGSGCSQSFYANTKPVELQTLMYSVTVKSNSKNFFPTRINSEAITLPLGTTPESRKWAALSGC